MNFIVNKYQGNVKLLLIACDEDEQSFLESHIGEVVELHAAQQPRVLDAAETCDCGEPFPESGSCIFCGARQRQRQ